MSEIIKLTLYSLFFYAIKAQELNVCNSFLDYYTMDSKNCWHNPELFMKTPEIIRRHNYPLEEYETVTEDGYYLTMFRMPKKDRKGLIYLQHPMLSNSALWIDKGVNDSLGFLLWDAGFEVWLGNFRGSTFSRKHKYLDTNSKKYWNFSFHEAAIYDIPAQIDLIASVSKARPQEISFAGVSMSATAAIIYATLKPEHSAKWINVLILMAPTTKVEKLQSLIGDFSPSIFEIEKIINYLNLDTLLSSGELIHALAGLCRMPVTLILCVIVDLVMFGNVPEEQPAKWIPIKYSHNPDGSAMKVIYHYGQIITSRRFQMYDYGSEGNLEAYGSEHPPEYPIENIKVPLFLVNAYHDQITIKEDVDYLYEILPKSTKIYGRLFVENASHGSFIYGTHTTENVYFPFIKLLNKISKEKNFS